MCIFCIYQYFCEWIKRYYVFLSFSNPFWRFSVGSIRGPPASAKLHFTVKILRFFENRSITFFIKPVNIWMWLYFASIVDISRTGWCTAEQSRMKEPNPLSLSHHTSSMKHISPKLHSIVGQEVSLLQKRTKVIKLGPGPWTETSSASPPSHVSFRIVVHSSQHFTCYVPQSKMLLELSPISMVQRKCKVATTEVQKGEIVLIL